MARIDGAIAERARRQLGLITSAQLDALGCTQAQRRRLREQRVLTKRSAKVWQVVAAPPDWRAEVLAAVWSAGPGAVASHRTAATLWHFDGAASAAQAPAPIEILVSASRHQPVSGATIRRTRDLSTTDRTQLGVVPATSRVRTLIDLASIMSKGDLAVALDGALRDGRVRKEALIARARMLSRPGRPGPRQMLEALGESGCGPRPETWLERELLRRLHVAGLPCPTSQVVIATGSQHARVDFAFEAERLVVEVDGHRTHSTRTDRQHDAEREARLVMRGWRVVRFTYEDVTERPDYVVATIRALLAQPT